MRHLGERSLSGPDRHEFQYGHPLHLCLAEPKHLQPQRRNARLGDLCVFAGLDSANAHGTQALPVLKDGNSTLQHGIQTRYAQERSAPPVDHVLISFAFAPAQCRRARLGLCDVGRYGCGSIQASKRKQMAPIVHDGNTDRPLVLQCFGLGCASNGQNVRSLQNGFGFHVVSPKFL